MKMSKKVSLITLTLITALVFAGGAFYRIRTDPVSRSEYIMGTLMEISAFGRNVEPAIEAAFERMREIEQQVGREENSDLSQLNTMAGGPFVKVRPDTWRMVKTAVQYWKLTEGAFDITVGPLVNLWGFGYGGEGRFPAAAQISALLPRIGSDKIKASSKEQQLRLAKVGMAVSVGGIAKGYAVQEAIKVLKAYGIQNAMVNGGSSSIKVIGSGPSHRGWRVGIEDPRRRGQILGVVRLQSGEAIGTSADNIRYFIRQGKRYSHIIDPRTGYPTSRGIALVTLISTNATEADILTKALFLNDLRWSMKFLKQRHLRAMLVRTDGKLFRTPGYPLESQ